MSSSLNTYHIAIGQSQHAQNDEVIILFLRELPVKEKDFLVKDRICQ
jgi:hypothetical protein